MSVLREASMRYQQCEFESPFPGGIVVGIDGSPESQSAVTAAARISTAWGCPVHVVSVLPPFDDYVMDPAIDQPEAQVEDLRFQIRDAAVHEMIDKADPLNEWTTQVETGSSASAIVDAAEHRGAELVVIGRTKYGIADGAIGGSTMLEIMQLTTIPVLAVALDFEMPRIAVVAVDFGASSTCAARVAMEILGWFGSLYLVHVEPAFELRTIPISRGGRDPSEILWRFRNLTAELPQRPGVTVETILLNGNPAKETLEFAESIGAELLAVGTEGTGSCGRFLWEGGARDLVRRSRIPIVAVPWCRSGSAAREFAFKKR